MLTPTTTERIELSNRLRSLSYLTSTATDKLESSDKLTAEYIDTINDLTRILTLVSKTTDAIIQRGMDPLAASAPKPEVLQR